MCQRATAGPIMDIRMDQVEAQAIETELARPFEVLRPRELKLPLVFNSPHSGRVYPSTFLAASKLDSSSTRIRMISASAANLGAEAM